MTELAVAKNPFRFCTRLHLTELTGLRAANLSQLCSLIKRAPDSCIYQHTHRFLQQYQYLSPEPPNDFAYWVTEALGEDRLGEELSNINTVQYSSIDALRHKLSTTIEKYSKDRILSKLKFSKRGQEFHFMKSINFILPTNYIVCDLQEFVKALQQITIDSIYFHIFEARLRLGRGTNDFSNWFENSLGNKKLADKIAKLDPYVYTLEDLRKTIIRIIEKQFST